MTRRKDAEYLSRIETGLVLERIISRKDSYSVIAEKLVGMSSAPMMSFFTVEKREGAWPSREKKPSRSPHGIDLPYVYQESALAHMCAGMTLSRKIFSVCTVLLRKVFRRTVAHCLVCNRLHPAQSMRDPGLPATVRKYFRRKDLVILHLETKQYLDALSHKHRKLLADSGVTKKMCMVSFHDGVGNVTRFFGNCTSDELLTIAAVIVDRSLFSEYHFLYE